MRMVGRRDRGKGCRYLDYMRVDVCILFCAMWIVAAFTLIARHINISDSTIHWPQRRMSADFLPLLLLSVTKVDRMANEQLS